MGRVLVATLAGALVCGCHAGHVGRLRLGLRGHVQRPGRLDRLARSKRRPSNRRSSITMGGISGVRHGQRLGRHVRRLLLDGLRRWHPVGRSRRATTPVRSERLSGKPGGQGSTSPVSGRGCNEISGLFQVKDIAFTGSTLTRLWIIYEQHCEGGTSALFGEVRVGEPPTSDPALLAPMTMRWPASDVARASTAIPATLVAVDAPVTISSVALLGPGAADYVILVRRLQRPHGGDPAAPVRCGFGSCPGPPGRDTRLSASPVPARSATSSFRALLSAARPGLT